MLQSPWLTRLSTCMSIATSVLFSTGEWQCMPSLRGSLLGSITSFLSMNQHVVFTAEPCVLLYYDGLCQPLPGQSSHSVLAPSPIHVYLLPRWHKVITLAQLISCLSPVHNNTMSQQKQTSGWSSTPGKKARAQNPSPLLIGQQTPRHQGDFVQSPVESPDQGSFPSKVRLVSGHGQKPTSPTKGEERPQLINHLQKHPNQLRASRSLGSLPCPDDGSRSRKDFVLYPGSVDLECFPLFGSSRENSVGKNALKKHSSGQSSSSRRVNKGGPQSPQQPASRNGVSAWLTDLDPSLSPSASHTRNARWSSLSQ